MPVGGEHAGIRRHHLKWCPLANGLYTHALESQSLHAFTNGLALATWGCHKKWFTYLSAARSGVPDRRSRGGRRFDVAGPGVHVDDRREVDAVHGSKIALCQ